MEPSTRAPQSRDPRELQALRLVPARPEHAAEWHRWRSEPTGLAHNPLPQPPSTVEDLERRLARVGSDLHDRTCEEYRFMVELEGELVGTVSAKAASRPAGYLEISYMMAERLHGRGLGTRAVALLVDRLFAETEIHRVFAIVGVENVASARLLERLGFVREGTLREHFLVQGRHVDQAVYGLLRREWRGAPAI